MAQQEPSNQSFLGTCIGVISSPVSTMQTIARTRPVGWALIVIVVTSFAQAITTSASIPPSTNIWELIQGPLQVFSFVGGPALAIPTVVFLTVICWIMSRILGGKGSYDGLFSGFGFAYLPTIFTVPVAFIALQFDDFALALRSMIVFGCSVWTIILSIFAVQTNNNFSTARAVAAAFIPLAIVFALLVALFAFVVIMVLP